MTSTDAQALIEEARLEHEPIHSVAYPGAVFCTTTSDNWPCLATRLADALESSEAARDQVTEWMTYWRKAYRDLTDKIEALAHEWHEDEQARIRPDQAFERRLIHGMETQLRGLVSGDKERTDG